jgi:hypothetical protein
MANSLSRIFLGASAALLLLGGAVHTLAFKKAVAAVAASDLAPFFGKALKGLWLIDSTMLITLAIVFGLIAVRPAMASSVVVALLTLMPAVVAILLYCLIWRNHACASTGGRSRSRIRGCSAPHKDLTRR